MYAVIESGGKQYKVAKDEKVIVERLGGEPGDTLEFDRVLIIGGDDGVKVGKPTIDGAKVTAEVVEQNRAKKIIVFKKKRRSTYRRKNGHRQLQTVVRITGIDG